MPLNTRQDGCDMSFQKVAEKIAKKKGISKERASAILAGGTRRAMRKRGMSTKHGIPKGVFKKHMSGHF